MNKKEYSEYVKRKARKSPITKNCSFAFLIGGLICTLAHGLKNIYLSFDLDERSASSLVSVTLILITAVLTGIGVFDNIAKVAGAGTIVPITGFANAVSSAAIDNKSEGYVLGVGAKMFVIAGPVIVFGLLSGAIYGVIYYIVGVFL
ncbi:MAG: stage V sporulation protein AC [Clostridia bacterium]|nr:stage V sporulation protein AC [Clostridia bacterium]